MILTIVPKREVRREKNFREYSTPFRRERWVWLLLLRVEREEEEMGSEIFSQEVRRLLGKQLALR